MAKRTIAHEDMRKLASAVGTANLDAITDLHTRIPNLWRVPIPIGTGLGELPLEHTLTLGGRKAVTPIGFAAVTANFAMLDTLLHLHWVADGPTTLNQLETDPNDVKYAADALQLAVAFSIPSTASTHLAIMERLLAHGASPIELVPMGERWTALVLAASLGNCAAIRLMCGPFRPNSLLAPFPAHADPSSSPALCPKCVASLFWADTPVHVDVDHHEEDRDAAIHAAAVKGNDDAVRLLVELGASVHALGQLSDTAMHSAAWCGHLSTGKLLHSLGASVSARNDNTDTPLHVASSKGHELVAFLLSVGAAANDRGKGGDSPLHVACRAGDLKAVQLLVDAGADLQARDFDGVTPLFRASKRGHIDVMTYLHTAAATQGLDLKAFVSAADAEGDTALHLAAAYAPSAAVRLLLAWGAPIDARGKMDDTPLRAACALGAVENVRLLVESGADTSIVDRHGAGILRACARAGVPVELYEWLVVVKGVKQPEGNSSPLISAALRGHIHLCKWMLEHGSDINERIGGDSDTLIQIAAGCTEGNVTKVERLAWVKYLLEHGAQVQVDNDPTSHPLNAACGVLDNADIISLLIEHGVEVNPEGLIQSPLHVAASTCPHNTACLLLHGADVHSTEDFGLTPLASVAFMSDEHKPEVCVQLLLDEGADVDAVDDAGQSVLTQMWLQRSPIAGKAVLLGGADPQCVEPFLHWDAKKSTKAWVVLLLAAGISLYADAGEE